MAFEKARTALAQLEEKLRRQFGLAGDIGARFDPILTPVIVVGDLRDAGNAANQGRAFAWTSGVVGVLNLQSVRTEQDVLINRVTVSLLSNANPGFIYLTVPGQSPAVAVTTLAGSWTDRKTVSTDQVPLTQSAIGARTGTAVSDQNRIWSGITGPAAGGIYLSYSDAVNWMLPAGSALNIESPSAGSQMVVTISGRIWP